MAEQRDQLDTTVWADEIQAQRYERSLVALWDELRTAEDTWDVLGRLPFETLAMGQPDRKPQPLDWGIRLTKLSAQSERFSKLQFSEKLAQLRRQGIRIVQTEWHHSRFEPLTDAGAPRSEVDFVIHATGRSELQRPEVRFIVRGTLLIEWSDREDGRGNPLPGTIDTRNVEILTRRGPPAFRFALTASRRNGQYASAMPILTYDLDRDGDAEIIFSRWNRVYWNERPGKFREGTFLDKFRPHWETGVIADFTGDGYADFLTAAKPDKLLLYVGSADGRFHGEGRPCADAQFEEPSAITAGDIDSDGDLDVFLTQYKLAYREGQMPTPFYDANDGYPSYLFVNDGTGRFSEETNARGLGSKRNRRTYSSSLVDLDDDGDLDLMVVSDFAGLDLYANDGHGVFVDATDKLVNERHLFGMAHTLGDYNRDGRLDFYVIGMSSTTARRLDRLGLGRDDRPDVQRMRPAMTFGNRMYLASGGRYQEPSFASHVARTGWSWGTTSFDFDNDGDRDIYVANGFRSGKSSQDYCTRYWCHDIYTGSSQPDADVANLFVDALREVNRGDISWNGYEHNVLLMNLDGKDFVNVAFLLGVSFEYDSRCVISEDLDGDGRCDLIVGEYHYDGRGFVLDAHVYQNNLETSNNWIGVKLHEGGRGFSPVGTKVTLKSAAGSQVARVVTGDSFMSQHANTVHFGLGADHQVDLIEVRWPSGTIRRLIDPDVNRYHTIIPEAEGPP